MAPKQPTMNAAKTATNHAISAIDALDFKTLDVLIDMAMQRGYEIDALLEQQGDAERAFSENEIANLFHEARILRILRDCKANIIAVRSETALRQSSLLHAANGRFDRQKP